MASLSMSDLCCEKDGPLPRLPCEEPERTLLAPGNRWKKAGAKIMFSCRELRNEGHTEVAQLGK